MGGDYVLAINDGRETIRGRGIDVAGRNGVPITVGVGVNRHRVLQGTTGLKDSLLNQHHEVALGIFDSRQRLTVLQIEGWNRFFST